MELEQWTAGQIVELSDAGNGQLLARSNAPTQSSRPVTSCAWVLAWDQGELRWFVFLGRAKRRASGGQWTKAREVRAGWWHKAGDS